MALGPIPDREPLAEATSRTMTPRWVLWLTSYVQAIQALVSRDFEGDGSPEGVVYARQGAIYHRRDGGAATTIYGKTTGGVSTLTNTGWVAIS